MRQLCVLAMVLLVCACGGTTTELPVKPAKPSLVVGVQEDTVYANQAILLPYTVTSGSVIGCNAMPPGWSFTVGNGFIHLNIGPTVDDDAVRSDGQAFQPVCFQAVDHGVSSDAVSATIHVLKPVVDQKLVDVCTHPDSNYKIFDSQVYTIGIRCPKNLIVTQDSPQGKWTGTKWRFGLFPTAAPTTAVAPDSLEFWGEAGGGPTRKIGIRIINFPTIGTDGGEMCFDVKLITSLPPDPTYPYDDSCAGIAKAEAASKSIAAADNVSLFNSMKSFDAQREMYNGSRVWFQSLSR